jgi:hypothetical protein
MEAFLSNELSSVSLARSRNVSSQWPDRQGADMPRPTVNAFVSPQGCDGEPKCESAQEIASAFFDTYSPSGWAATMCSRYCGRSSVIVNQPRLGTDEDVSGRPDGRIVDKRP